MRRILVLLSVVAMMVVMLATSVTPAFADPPFVLFCTNPQTNDTIGPFVVQGGTVGSCKKIGYTDIQRVRV